MRQVVGFEIGPREGVLLEANLGRAILTNGNLLLQRRGPLPKLLWTEQSLTKAITAKRDVIHKTGST